MDDLISRQDALNALGEEPLVWNENTDEWELGKREQWREDVEAIKSVPSAQSEHEYTMEEFMYGQDMGNPEDGGL